MKDYWIGAMLLMDTTGANFRWISDCSTVEHSAFYQVKNGTTKCIILKKDDLLKPHEENCDTTKPYICEIPLEGSVCPYNLRLESLAEVIPVDKHTTTQCRDFCDSRGQCWGMMAYDDTKSKKCVMLMSPDSGMSVSINITSKYCIRVDYNDFPYDGTKQKLPIPAHSCPIGVTPIIPTPTSTTFYSMTSTSLYCPPEIVTVVPTTVNVVTATVNHTVNATSTLYPIITNITYEVAVEIAKEIEVNLTVPKKSTYQYKISLTSAYDPRPSSRLIGIIGLMFVAVPTVVLLIADLSKVIRDLRNGPTYTLTS